MSGTAEAVLVGVAGVSLAAAWLAAALGLARVAGSPPGGPHAAAAGPPDTARSGPAAAPPGPVAAAAPGPASGGGAVRRVFWWALAAGLVAETAVLVIASLQRGTVAVYDQAEFLFAMSWVTTLVLAWFARRGAPWVIPVVVLPLALLFLGGAVLAPPGSGEVRPASLTSGWLLLHILTSVVAYAAFSVCFAAAAVTLARHYRRRSLAAGASGGQAPVGVRGATIERIGYQAAVFGFPFMTMVLFSGALWARYVWGRYWAWDPIEAWGLVTWLVYAAYLHAHYSRRWGGVGTAWLAVLGFGCVIATYLFFTHLWF